MPLDKLEILTGVLEKQVTNFTRTAEQMKKDMHEHNGARQALEQLAKQFLALSVSIEDRIDKDKELGSSADKVLVYSKNIFARVHAMAESNAKAQMQQRFIAQGRMEAALQAVEDFQKEIETQKAFVAKRERLAEDARKAREAKEIEEEVKQEAKEAAEEAEKEVAELVENSRPPDKKPSKGNGVPDKKDAKKKKAAAAKKKAAKSRKKKAAKKPQPKLPLDGDKKTGETDSKPDGSNTGQNARPKP